MCAVKWQKLRKQRALLPQVDNAVEVVALVRADKLSWHRVQLPRGTLGRRMFQEGGPSRLRAVLESCLADNRQAWELGQDGRYRRRYPGDLPVRATQHTLMRDPWGRPSATV